jgi:TonB family protein
MRHDISITILMLLLVPAAQPQVLGQRGQVPNTATAIDPRSPQSVAVDAAGNLYVVSPSVPVVYKIAPSGAISAVAGTGTAGFSGDGGPAIQAQLRNPTAVTLDAAGNLYISDSADARIRKVTPDGAINTVAGTGMPGFSGDGGPATSAELTAPIHIATDVAGNLYILGGARVRKVTTGGVITTIAGTGTTGFAGDGGPATSAPLTGPYSIAVDAAGNLYIAERGNHRVRKVTPNGIISTIAGVGSSGFSGDGSTAVSAQLAGPGGVVADEAGNLYITDSLNTRIRKITPDGKIDTIAGTGTRGFSGDGGPATAAQFGLPVRVVRDSAGSLYIADLQNLGVRKITPQGLISTIAPALNAARGAPGPGPRGGRGGPNATTGCPAVSPTVVPPAPVGTNGVFTPQGVAVDGAGNIYVVAPNSPTVRKITPAGMVTTIAGTGTAGFSGDGGPATAAQLRNPIAVTVDSANNVYVADNTDSRVRKIAPSGTITTVAGNGIRAYGGDGGPATSACLVAPNSVVVDGAGNVFIGDTNGRVRKVTTDGIITTFAGSTYGFGGDGGPATAAGLTLPTALAFDSAGNLYIADSRNFRIRKVTTDGVIETVAGTGTSGFAGDDGPASNAQIGDVTGIAVDNAGNLYIADRSNYRIRKVTPDGVMHTIAGTGFQGSSGDGGPAAAARIMPYRIATDRGSNIYVTDFQAGVRLITPAGIIRTVVASNANAPATAARVGFISARASYSPYPQIPETARVKGIKGFVELNVDVDATGKVTAVNVQRSLDCELDLVAAYAVTNWRFEPARQDGQPVASTLSNYRVNFSTPPNQQPPGSSTPPRRLKNPLGVAVDAAGNVYIADTGNARIVRVGGGSAVVVAGNGNQGLWGDGGPATSAQLKNPSGVVVDAAGNLYIADTGNAAIRKVLPNGLIGEAVGTGTAGFGGDGARAMCAQVKNPSGIALDAQGRLYIADTGNSRVRGVAANGAILTLAGNGTAGFGGDGSPSSSAQLKNPESVAVDAAGNIYIADTGNARIRKIALSGVISTVAGTGVPGFSGDGGPAAAAQLKDPTGISVDSAGNIYIADTANNRIRKIDTNGMIHTIAGNGTAGFGGDSGPATSALLKNPAGVAVDAAGNIYIADSGNNRLRQISTDGMIRSIIGQ